LGRYSASVNVLAVIHGEKGGPELFGQVVREHGHELEEWSLAWGRPLERPLADYGAVLVFGGGMHADQDDRHPWLVEENFFLQRLLGLGTPVLGVCLGAQLVAKASHAPVHPSSEPEIGWVTVALTEAADDDPLFARLPQRFHAFQWHYYTYGIPAGAEELAYSRICTQAFRLGETAWGVQFHPEVTREQLEGWIDESERELPIPRDLLAEETLAHISEWNEIGRMLCGSFLEVAARVAAPA
jgi:GMP synthase-like glutamine amidotransferase